MSSLWIHIVAIALGSAIGGILRFLIREYLPLIFKVDFLFGTLTVNILGCLVAGIMLVYWQNTQVSPVLKSAVMVGFLGALTTFSSFAVDTYVLFQEQQLVKAVLNVLLNTVICLIAVFFGAWIGGRIAQS